MKYLLSIPGKNNVIINGKNDSDIILKLFSYIFNSSYDYIDVEHLTEFLNDFDVRLIYLDDLTEI